jgi:hypothetical protein
MSANLVAMLLVSLCWPAAAGSGATFTTIAAAWFAFIWHVSGTTLNY